MYIHGSMQPSLQLIWEQQKPHFRWLSLLTPYLLQPYITTNPLSVSSFTLRDPRESALWYKNLLFCDQLFSRCTPSFSWSHEGTEPPAHESGSPEGGWAWGSHRVLSGELKILPQSWETLLSLKSSRGIRLQHSSFFASLQYKSSSLHFQSVVFFPPSILLTFRIFHLLATKIHQGTKVYNPLSGCQSIWILVIFSARNCITALSLGLEEQRVSIIYHHRRLDLNHLIVPLICQIIPNCKVLCIL